MRGSVLSKIGLALIVLFTLCAIFAPLLAPYSPWQIDLPQRLMTPSAHHWFGTDELGRDILSRTIYGARISLLVGVSVVVVSLGLGLIVGCVSGYYGGRIDR